MAGETDIPNLTLALLRKVDERTERMAEDLHDIKVRMSSLETNLAAMNRRMDRFETRLERIERRLDLIPAPPG
jgi:predicted  nucleic acid-binding Zn-ribbon protein